MRGRCPGWMLVVGIVALAVLTAAAPAGRTRTVDSAPTAEAWYRTTVLADEVGGALCAAVLCPTVPLNPYPEDTLHVGVAAGEPDSVTVIALPSPGEVPLGGTLTVPLAEPEAGTANAEAARVLACVATGPFDDVEAGAPEETPEIDCTHSAPAVVDTAEPMTLTVDLAPLAAGWPVSGELGVALVADPDDSDDGGASWHLAFSGRDRDVEGAQPSSATLLLPAATPAPEPDGDTTPPAPAPPPPAPASVDPPAPAVDRSISPPVMAAPPVESAPPPSVAPPQQPAPPPAGGSAEVPVAAPAIELPYAYPAAWLLPLVLLAGVSGLGHALKQEVLVIRDLPGKAEADE